MYLSSAGPAVSVVMPVYNEAHVVQTAIDSILRQTRADFELVIVDNGSTDSTPQVLRAIHDPRVRVFRNALNLGSAAAANRAVRESSSPFVARMDAGNIAVPHRLEKQLAAFAADPLLALLGAQVDTLGARERSLLRTLAPKPVTSTGIRWQSLFGSPFVHSTVMFRREIFEAVGGYDERMQRSSEFAMFSRIQERYRAVNLPDVLVRYRSRRRDTFTDTAYAGLVRHVIERNTCRALDPSSADPCLAQLITVWPDYCMMLRGSHIPAARIQHHGLLKFLSAFAARFHQLYCDPIAAVEIAADTRVVLCRSAWDALRRRHRCAMRLGAESFAHAPLFAGAFFMRQLADGAMERLMRKSTGSIGL